MKDLLVKKGIHNKGFTIVELLIVIVIIGILAALVIVAYNGIQNRAYDTTVQSDLNAFIKKLEIVKVDTTDSAYPVTFNAAMGFTFTRSAYLIDPQGRTLRYCTNATNGTYIMFARSKSGNYFKATSSGGVQATTEAYGWSICSQIGLVTTNPTSDGLVNASWSSWVN